MRIVGIFTLMLLLFFSCKKEETPVYPVVELETPVDNAVFTGGDTVHIKGRVLHDKPLTKVSMALVDMDLVPVSTRFNLNPSGNEYPFNTNIIIDNPELPSGNYYLHIRAGDGTYETNHYTKIYIYEAPLITEHIFVMTWTNTAGTEVYTLDSALTPVLVSAFSSDYGFSAVDGINKLLYVSGAWSGTLFCYNYDTKQLLWSENLPGSAPWPFITGSAMNKRRIFLSVRQNAVMAYNSSGSLVYNLPTASDRYPSALLFHENLLVTSQNLLNGQQAHLTAYFSESGAVLQNLPAALFVLSMFTKDAGNIIVFGHALPGGTPEIRIYDIEANGLWEPYNLTTDAINEVVQVDAQTYLLACGSGVYRYTYNPSGVVKIIDNTNATQLCYEPVTGLLFVGTPVNKLQVYSYPQCQLLKEITFNGPVKDVVVAYNKNLQ